MPILLPDTSKAEDMDPSVANSYRGIVLKVEGQVSKEKKIPQAVVSVRFTGVPREDNNEPRDITRMCWLNMEGAGSMGFDQFLRALKLTDIADRVRAGEKVPIDTSDLENKPITGILKVGEYNGRRRDEIHGFLPA